MLFSNTGGLVSSATPISPSGASFTLSAWVNRFSTSTHDAIFAQGTEASHIGLYFKSDSTLQFVIPGKPNLATSPLLGLAHTWVHVTAVYSASENMRYLYMDGVQIASLATVSPGSYPLVSMYFGAAAFTLSGAPMFFDGS
jgi:hypothetical protein